MDERRGSGLVLPAERVRITDEAVRIGPSSTREPGDEPKIELIHEDDTIRMIQVTCTCGERICIRCDYA